MWNKGKKNLKTKTANERKRTKEKITTGFVFGRTN